MLFLKSQKLSFHNYISFSFTRLSYNFVPNTVKRAKFGEQSVLAIVFCFFLLENRKNSIRSLQTFFVSLRRFLHSLHSTTVASGRYVFREGLLRPPLGHPKGAPTFAPDSTALRSRLHDPRSFRSVSFVTKSRSGSKKVFENKSFFCSPDFSPFLAVLRKKNSV